MKPPPPPGPPDVADLRELIDQWAEFTAGLAIGYSFDLDNWLNDVDVRELILEALPMFSREEMGDHALKLDAGRQGLHVGDPRLQELRVGQGHRAQGEMDAAEELVVLPHADALELAARRRARDRSLKQ